jgi:sigma-B regulation protein RsbU (phosphoserine phosphatase)
MLKFKIKTKVMIIILGLPVLSIVLFNFQSFFTLNQLGKSSIENINELGDTAAADSAAALREHARKYLMRTAVDQAALSNALFEKVESAANIIAWYTEKTWNNPASVIAKPSYEWNQRPQNGEPQTVIKIAPGQSRDKIEQDIHLSSNLDDLFQSVRENDPNIKSVYIGTTSGLQRRAPFTSKRKASYDPRKREWYKLGAKSRDTGWTDLYISASEEILMVTCYRAAYDAKNNLIGVIGLDIALSSLNDRIINTQVGKKGYALLLDKSGKVIAHPKLTKGSQKWDESFKTENWLTVTNQGLGRIALEMTRGARGVQQGDFDGGEKYIAYAPIKSTNWSIGVVMPVDEIVLPAKITKEKIISRRDDTEKDIKKRLSSMQWQALVFFLGIIIAISIIALKLSNTITKPMISLTKGAQVIGNGKLDYKIDIKTGDELEDLADAFNKMADDLKVYIQNLQETTAAKERIQSELNVAREIQLGLLHKIFPPFPAHSQFDLFAMLEPAKEVGGDLYDFFLVDDDHLCFALGDVSDKGVPAALFMTITMALIRNTAQESFNPAFMMSKINDTLSADNPRAMFVTLIIGILNIRTGKVLYANGGHNPPILIRNDGAPVFKKELSGPLVGHLDGLQFKDLALKLNPGDYLFLYTDGVTEALNRKNEFFSDARLLKEMGHRAQKDVEGITREIRRKINEHTGSAPQSDDIAMMMIRFNGPCEQQGHSIFSRSGRPYKSALSAKTALERRKDLDPQQYSIKELSGRGWVIAQKK